METEKAVDILKYFLQWIETKDLIFDATHYEIQEALNMAVTALHENQERDECADTAWNRRAKPEARALTVEELQEMDGMPVWVELQDDFYKGYYIVDANNQSLCGMRGVFVYDSVFIDGLGCTLFDRQPVEGCRDDDTGRT